jgi:hypothetical protein
MITPQPAASAPRTGFRPIAFVGIMIAMGIVVGALAAWLLVPPPSFPPSRLVGWRLADGFLGTPRFDPLTAHTTTAVPIAVDWLSCAPQDDSWLGPPAISYTPWSVTITMHTTDAFAATTTCGGGNDSGGRIGIMLDVGIPVEVRLSEPLRGRALFDGAGSPSQARAYP